MRLLRDIAVTTGIFILMYAATGYLYKKADVEKSTLTWLFIVLYSALFGLYFFLLHRRIPAIGILTAILSVIALALMFLYEGAFMIVGPLLVLVTVVGVNQYTNNAEG
jgi:hypothetical protein